MGNYLICYRCQRFAPAGIEKPLVMKSACCLGTPLLVEKRLLTLSFEVTFLRLALSCSSARTRAVKDAVPAFLIAPFAFGASSFSKGFNLFVTSWSGFSLISTAAFFFRFFPEPLAFFRECVRPCSRSFDIRFLRCSLSAEDVGRILMIFSAS